MAGSPRIPDFSPDKSALGKGNTSRAGRGVSLPPKQLTNSVNKPWSILALKKVKREAAAQRRQTGGERKDCAFLEKWQAVWFEMQSISN